ncbi:ion transporter [soil metagenome]
MRRGRLMAFDQHPPGRRRARLYQIIFEADTPAGKAFDVVLIVAILLSVLAVMLESVAGIRERHLTLLRAAEWVFTILFTVEYLLRLVAVRSPRQYALSFFGVVDLLAIVPTYLSVLLPGAQYLLAIRLLRILRVFRVLKLMHWLNKADILMAALRQSRRKITVFIFAVLTLDVILGSMMYLVEGPEHGFTSIPVAIYWTIVTLTTVGYGDISPQTPLGQSLASLIMIIGYGIIAVPTGIVTAELTRAGDRQPIVAPANCPRCETSIRDADARFCRRCGEQLPRVVPA